MKTVDRNQRQVSSRYVKDSSTQSLTGSLDLRKYKLEVAGYEFIEAADGRLLTYDVNTNTNYNPDVEAVAPKSGPGEIAKYLQAVIAEHTEFVPR